MMSGFAPFLKGALVLLPMAGLATVAPQNPSRVREIAAKLRPKAGFAETRAGAPFWMDALDAKVRRKREVANVIPRGIINLFRWLLQHYMEADIMV